MIDKETRKQIAILLLKRRKRLGQKKINILDLYFDFNWLQLHSGMIMDELEKKGIVKE